VPNESKPVNVPRRRPPVAPALIGAFCVFTLAWIAWGLTTPGDFFANGNPACMPTLAAAVVVGLALGHYAGRRRSLRWGMVAVAILFVVFWVFAPEGWWAKGPPHAAPAAGQVE
jgi:hypothetical protein